ncbi:MAG: hypothetical protein ACW98X_13235 [Promethearchaeota archaeon]
MSQTLNNLVEAEIKQFLITLSNRYDIDSIQLWSEWIELQEKRDTSLQNACDNIIDNDVVIDNKPVEKSVDEPVEVNKTIVPIDMKHLIHLKGDALRELCVTNGLTKQGNVSALRDKLSGKCQPVVAKSKKQTKSKIIAPAPSVQKKLSDMLSSEQENDITIKRNQYNNYEHPKTSFIFDKSKQVIGVQNDDGSIEPLSEADIETCNKYKFDYIRPFNLDIDDGKTDAVIDDISDDDDEGDIDEEELLSDISDDDLNEDIDEYEE